MKLDRCGTLLAVLVASFVMGCGARASTKVASCPPSPTVSTTTLMAAELSDTDEAPKVGKSQHTAAPSVEEEPGEKDDAPQRRVDRRPGGGFSGYK